MPLVTLFALALMTAEPPAVAPAASAPKVVPEDPVPPGAPSDDYGLVNWCTGALAGHMTLYRQVKPELDALPDSRPKETATLDSEQMKAGRDYLTLYKRATDAAEKASPRNIGERGLTERRTGNAIWSTARSTTDRKSAMWTWLSWELPGRCETAAERLYEKSLLSAQALGVDLVGGSSAASQKPVVPQITPPAPKASASSTTPAKSPAKPGTGATAAVSPSKARVAQPAAPPALEDQIQAEIDGRPLAATAAASPRN
jgi:hypothetical protein